MTVQGTAAPRCTHLVVTGMMGVGKSTTADLVARELGLLHRDSDQDIEHLFGCSGGSIASDLGIEELHRIESAVLLGSLASPHPMVVSAAAWVVEDPRCREALKRLAFTVVLDLGLDQLITRIPAVSHRRNLPISDLLDIKSRRADLFADVADLTLSADAEPNALAAEICAAWTSHSGG